MSVLTGAVPRLIIVLAIPRSRVSRFTITEDGKNRATRMALLCEEKQKTSVHGHGAPHSSEIKSMFTFTVGGIVPSSHVEKYCYKGK